PAGAVRAGARHAVEQIPGLVSLGFPAPARPAVGGRRCAGAKRAPPGVATGGQLKIDRSSGSLAPNQITCWVWSERPSPVLVWAKMVRPSRLSAIHWAKSPN